MSSNAPPLDIPIDMPEVINVGEDSTAVEYVNFLLTSLLHYENGLLHAQFCDGIGVCYVRSRLRLLEGEDVAIARFDDRGKFRTLLARVGFWYMASQLYGGFARRILTQRGRKHSCVIYMSNDSWTGYWLKVYARATPSIETIKTVPDISPTNPPT